MIVALIATVWGFYPLMTGVLRGIKDLKFSQWIFLLTAIPLVRAARIAFEKTEGSFFGALQSRLNHTKNERLENSIDGFLNRKLEMFGKSPPSSVLRKIPSHEMSELKWMPGTNSLISMYAANPGRYEDVIILRSSFKKYLESLKRLALYQV